MLKELESVPVGVQGLEASGTVTAEDYRRVFEPLVDRARRAKSRVRLVFQFGPQFERLTTGALWADARLGWGYTRVLDGCAVVSDIEWIRDLSRGVGASMPCPVRVYRNSELDDAVAWLNSLPEGGKVSVWGLIKAFVGGTVAVMRTPGAL